MLLSRRQHAVDNVVLALIGVLDRLQLLLIVLLADVDHRPILRFGKPDVGENAVVDDLVYREIAVNDLVVAVDRKQQLLPDLLGFLFERGVAACFRGLELGFRQLLGFSPDFLA